MEQKRPAISGRRKGRRVAAIVLGLVALYPLSLSLVFYGIGRGWLPRDAALLPVFSPILKMADEAVFWTGSDDPAWKRVPGNAVRGYTDFLWSCYRAGRRHRPVGPG